MKLTKKTIPAIKEYDTVTFFNIEGLSVSLPKDFINYVIIFLNYQSIESWKIALKASLDKHKVKDKDGNLVLPEHLKKRQDKIIGLFSIIKYPNHPKIKPNMKQIDDLSDEDYKKNHLAFCEIFDAKIQYIVKYLQGIEELQQRIPVLEYDAKIQKHLTDLLINTLKHTNHENIEEIMRMFNISNYTLPESPKLNKKELNQYFEYGELLLGCCVLYAELREFWLELYKIKPSLTKYFDIVMAENTYQTRREAIFKYMSNCGNGGFTKDRRYDKARELVKKQYDKLKNENISANAIYNELYETYTGACYSKDYLKLIDEKKGLKNEKTLLALIRKFDKENNIDRKKAKRTPKGERSKSLQKRLKPV